MITSRPIRVVSRRAVCCPLHVSPPVRHVLPYTHTPCDGHVSSGVLCNWSDGLPGDLICVVHLGCYTLCLVYFFVLAAPLACALMTKCFPY